jgi:hypothetical protein
MHIFRQIVFIHMAILIIKIICFTTLVDKIENKLGKTYFTLKVYVINFFFIKDKAEK